MRLAELQGLAASMGITGTAKMRKGDLVTAIKARQSGSAPAADRPATADRPAEQAPAQREQAPAQREQAPAQREQAPAQREQAPAQREQAPAQREQTAPRRGRQAAGDQSRAGSPDGESREGQQRRGRDRGESHEDRGGDSRESRDDRDSRGENRQDNRGGDNRQDRGDRGGEGRPDVGDRGGEGRQDNRDSRRGNEGRQDNRDLRGGADDEGDGRGRRSRSRNRSRSRDKRRGGREVGDYETETLVSDDDVLVPVAGILDVLENYAFVRTSGYLPGANDVYVPLGMVKKNGMRKGDAVTGAVKVQREDQQQNSRQKFNALVRLDTVNGMSPEDAKKRVEFGKLTPLYPQQRLRLETEPNVLTTRIIDLVAPIGKGQRGLIVAPAKAGKTMVMQAIANAITTNNPECHLMVVLVDERPEEVTDMQRAVKGEVISSTFDRPAEDHTTVAELAIERAKRLVEMGHDVVVLLDSITKLGRAYNLAAPASGRILSGGVDSAALYPPKKFFGAARNIEDGGSLTILATALVETGSRMDEVIFEEFKGTGNMELKLDRGLANRRIFPAVDVNASGTRREEILLSGEELKIMWKLRRVLAALDQQQGIELLIDRLKKTKSNVEFLMQVQQTSSIRLDDEDRD
ncbi:MAG TPA: transcription termination factor Rho [Pedococcus sp.]|nr:transcription termination factor Rho [Pedococcus sp.]